MSRSIFRPFPRVTSATLLALLAFPVGGLAAAEGSALDVQHDQKIKPLLVQYCMDCHDAETAKGDVDLDPLMKAITARQQGTLLARVAHAVEAGEMPPKKKDQPTPAERDALVAWLKAIQVDEARAHAGDPGVVVMPRLTREQFALVAQHLTGVPTSAHLQMSPGAGSGEGFTNVGSDHTMTTNDVDAWMAGLRVLLRQALITPGMDIGWVKTAPPEAVTGAEVRKRYVDLWGGWFREEFRAYHARNFGEGKNVKPPLGQFFAGAIAMEKGATLEAAAAAMAAPGAAISLARWHAVLTGPVHANPFIARVQEWWKAVPRTGDVTQACGVLDEQVKALLLDTTFGHKVPKFQKVVTNKEQRIAIDKGEIPFTINLTEAGKSLKLIVGQALAAPGARVVWKNGTVTLANGTQAPWQGVAQLNGATFTGDGVEMAAPAVATVSFPAGATSVTVTAVPAPGQGEATVMQAGIDVLEPTDLVWVPGLRPFGPKGVKGSGVSTLLEAHKDAHALLLDLTVDGRWNAQSLLGFYATAMGEPAPAWDAVGLVVKPLASKSLVNPRPEDLIGAATLERQAELRDIGRRLRATLMPEHYRLAQALKAAGVKDPQEGIIPPGVNLTGEAAALAAQVRAAEAGLVTSATAQITAFATRAWRRVPTAGEVDRLRAIYQQTRDEGLAYEAGVSQALLAVMLSPEFLYRLEAANPTAKGTAYALPGFDVSERLSLTLWSTMPDPALLQPLLVPGAPTPEAMVPVIERMVADDRVRGFVMRFAGEWLKFDDFASFSAPDPKRFKAFTPELAKAMEEEARRFFIDLFQNNRPPTDVILGTHTFLNESLARHYDVKGVKGPEFRRVAWGDSGRAGVFGMGAFLTKTSTPLRTSPVKRGVWAWEGVLGIHIAQPPVVPRISDDERSPEGLSIRQQLEKHRSDAACMSCHAKFDPLGIALENFDAIGRWRDKDLSGKPVESTEKAADGSTIAGPRGLTQWLAQAPQRKTFLAGFARKLLVYALGRDVLLSDQPLLDDLVAKAEQGAGARDLLVGVLTSSQYRMRRDPVESAPSNTH